MYRIVKLLLTSQFVMYIYIYTSMYMYIPDVQMESIFCIQQKKSFLCMYEHCTSMYTRVLEQYKALHICCEHCASIHMYSDTLLKCALFNNLQTKHMYKISVQQYITCCVHCTYKHMYQCTTVRYLLSLGDPSVNTLGQHSLPQPVYLLVSRNSRKL